MDRVEHTCVVARYIVYEKNSEEKKIDEIFIKENEVSELIDFLRVVRDGIFEKEGKVYFPVPEQACVKCGEWVDWVGISQRILTDLKILRTDDKYTHCHKCNIRVLKSDAVEHFKCVDVDLCDDCSLIKKGLPHPSFGL